MFRKMRREKQTLTFEECVELLNAETRGVLSVNGDDGYPYGLPINYYYDEKENKIYFHGGTIGHRVDAINNDPKVSFCVFGQEEKKEEDWAYYVKSVIIFGKARAVEDYEEIINISRKLCDKFPAPAEYVEFEINKSAQRTLCYEITVEHMTGKLVHEA